MLSSTSFYFNTYSQCQGCSFHWIGGGDICQTCGSEKIIRKRAKVKRTHLSWCSGFLCQKTMVRDIEEIVSIDGDSTSIVVSDKAEDTEGWR